MTSLQPENFPHRQRPRQRRQASRLRAAEQGGPQTTLTAEIFAEVEAEFRVGDRLMFTRNDRQQDRRNGMIAMVTGVDPDEGGMMVAMPDGTSQWLDPRRIGDRHIRQG